MAQTGDITGKEAGQSGVVSEFAGEYVSDMLGKTKALADKPYSAYGGPLTAGSSGLQDQAFAGYGALDPNQQTGIGTYGGSTAPGSYGGGINAGSFGFGSAAGQGYSSGFNAGSADLSGMGMNRFQNNYNPQAFNAQAAQQYMNPYLQAALNPQLDMARREMEKSRLGDASRLTQAGAFGGSRQALMDAETGRNFGQNVADITGQGYARAFDSAQGQFNTEQQRLMADRDARMGQFNTEENMRQRIAEVGIDQFNKEQAGLRTDEEARRGQFNTEENMRQRIAEVGIDQFNKEQAGLRTDEEARRGQFNTEAGRQSAFDESRRSQFNEEERARRELEERRRSQFNTESDRQMQFDEYGRNQFNTEERNRIAAGESDRRYGLDALSAIGKAGDDQRRINQEGITADYLQYQQEQQYPYEQLQFMQSMLEGLPVAARQTSYVDPSSSSQVSGGLAEILALLGYA
tara:strand:+ start:19 stop:1404 length:1386 start_codon:yes stop_codon:yes gene_type:complete